MRQQRGYPYVVAVRASAWCERGDEGVIAKLADSPYEGGRSRDWLKFKCCRDQEFVVVGYTAPKGSRVGLGALLLGYYDSADLVYAGKVGTGFDDATLRSLHERLSRTEQKTPPITKGACPASRGHTGCDRSWWRRWHLANVTRDGKLRHPRYLGLRTDKRPDEVVRETR
jgi:bifunctional non-homologous end joining protein LigD